MTSCILIWINLIRFLGSDNEQICLFLGQNRVKTATVFSFLSLLVRWTIWPVFKSQGHRRPGADLYFPTEQIEWLPSSGGNILYKKGHWNWLGFIRVYFLIPGGSDLKVQSLNERWLYKLYFITKIVLTYFEKKLS